MPVWTDNKRRRFKSRRPNGWPIDDFAIDGVVASGWRKVNKGKIKFNNQYWYSEKLNEYNGKFVRVEPSDLWFINVIAFLGDKDLTPHNLPEKGFSSFYDWRRSIVLENVE